MRRALRLTWIIICICVTAVYLLSCFTPFIPPSAFSFISLFALLFPFLFVAAIFCGFSLLFISRKGAFLVLLVIIIAGYKNLHSSFALNSGKWQMDKTPGALRIMTWNCEDFLVADPPSSPLAKPRLDMMAAIKQYNPDVLCLQEFRDMRNDRYMISVRKEVEALGYIHGHFSLDSVLLQYYPDTVDQGVAIFSKLPLSNTGTVNLVNKGTSENLIYADVTFNNQPLRIFTAHLLSYGLYYDTVLHPTKHDNIYQLTYRRKKNIQAKIREAEIVHANEVATIRNTMAQSPHPIVYCGDINSTPPSYTYHKLRGGLQDAFLEKGFGIGNTFYKISPTLRIDVSLVDDKLQVLQCIVPKLYLSDHFPIVTDIAWKK